MPSTVSPPSRTACTIICAATKPSGENRSGVAPRLLEVLDHRGLDVGAGGSAEVVVQERDVARRPSPYAPYVATSPRPVTTGHRVEHALLGERSPHRARGGAAHATKTRSGCAAEQLLRERRELGGVLGDEHALDGGAPAAEHGLHGREVALAERVVLREDDDLLAVGVADEGAGGRDVLVGLSAGAERVLVDAGDGVGRGRTRDVEDLVLRGLLGERGGDARDDGAARIW